MRRHSWFGDVDWEAAERRELRPPEPRVKEVREELVGVQLFDRFGMVEKVEGWEFANSEDI